MSIKALIFDWGDTVMRDFPEKSGAMADWDNVECIEGVIHALKVLSEQYVCCIATNAGISDTALMIRALERVDLKKYFSLFVSSKDIGVEKPDPDFFKYISSKIGVRVEECVHVGNLYEKDIIGAKLVGMKTVFFNEKNIQGNFELADEIICKMSQLVAAIKRIS